MRLFPRRVVAWLAALFIAVIAVLADPGQVLAAILGRRGSKGRHAGETPEAGHPKNRGKRA
ncbi:MAG: hypothetical protein JWQ95_5891 [Sphaerisporangium sp.]|jgi:hypothetical protein|nr:hypothetical protein [Sphaerisporangium sp.]